MSAHIDRSLRMNIDVERWSLAKPLRTAVHVMESADLLVVTLENAGRTGRGESVGVFYRGETADSMVRQLEAVRGRIESGMTRDELLRLLPAAGARNALDCALWDLEAKLSGVPVWRAAGLDQPRKLLTTLTCSADEPERMAAAARAYLGARALKLKLTGEPVDAERVRAVRSARPSAWIGVDANQSFTPQTLHELMPVLLEASVSLIEQPFAAGREDLMEGLVSPIPVAADESVQDLNDVQKVTGRFNVVNIKLDKCGGLTEGLAMAHACRAAGLAVMVGNMIGTSLAMAPAFVLGQLCDVVDLDGPVFLVRDRDNPVRYMDGYLECDEMLWGGPASRV